MIMKKIMNMKIVSLSLILVILATVACKEDFLDVTPTGSLTAQELTSGPGLDGALIGAYSMLLGRSGFYSDASNWFWGSVLGGDANKGTDPGDQSQVNEIQTYSTQTNNASVNQKYRALYEGISRANRTILLAQTPRENVSAELVDRVIAEARFLRGHFYFDLKKIFNNTPYVDETWDGYTDTLNPTLIGNSTDLWPFIEADLQFAYDNLPETQSEAGRANKWAAGAYLGKALLFQDKFDEARTVFDDVIAKGKTANGAAYALVEPYSAAFRSTTDNSSESVFAVQAAAGTGSTNNANAALVLNFPHGSGSPERPGGCCGFNQPSFDLVNSYRVDAEGLPLLDGSYNSNENAVANDMGLKSDDDFSVDEDPVDPRLDHSVGRRGIPYLDWGPHPGADWIRNQPNGGPFSPKKFVYYKEGIGEENDASSWTPGYTTVNYNIIRFADVLLMAAEAEIKAGSLAQALVYINQVRARAAASVIKADFDDDYFDNTAPDAANYNVGQYTAFAGVAEATEALRMERKLELSGEGHRFYDLVRWGIAEATLNAYLKHEIQFLPSPFADASFSANQDEYMPIPQNDIDFVGSDLLIQNPGY